jgi:hypothetical protein
MEGTAHFVLVKVVVSCGKIKKADRILIVKTAVLGLLFVLLGALRFLSGF